MVVAERGSRGRADLSRGLALILFSRSSARAPCFSSFNGDLPGQLLLLDVAAEEM